MRFDIFKLDATTSTNDDVKTAAEAGVPEGLVVHALAQNAGRGRLGRTWQSPEGNLYFSVLLRPPLPKRVWGNYSFVAGVAIAEAVSAILPAARVELKWPNDVLVGGKKISGILLESGEDWLVIGMGINVLHVPESPLYPTTCLAAEKAITDETAVIPVPSSGVIPAEAGIQRVASATQVNQSDFNLDDVLNQALESFGEWYEKMNASGFGAVRAAWLSRARKGTLRVRLPSAGQEITGEFVDLDAEGNLVLRLADNTERRISAGDVFL
ncbi:MAG: biotin--[acetyl-CoA-carboxylase] ligase [Bdellovibrionales bacterium]